MSAWLQSCSALDYLILAAALFLVIRGFVRGCSGELGRLIGIAAAAAVLLFERGTVGSLIGAVPAVRENLFARQILTLTVLLVACVSVWLLVGRLFTRLIKLAVNQPLDAILGGVIGAIKVFLLICILCMMGLIGPRGADRDAPGLLEKGSTVVRRITPWIKPFAPPT